MMEEKLAVRRELVETYLQKYFRDIRYPETKGLVQLLEAMKYSALSGGKRFRPVLSVVFCEAFGVNPVRVLPWGAAVEMIHTYSLIHDDLPCMDNDDLRRGKPTNHKVFGEAQALLAGDGLLTEAFGVIGAKYSEEPSLAVKLVRLLSEAAGFHGMVGGQAIDMLAQAGEAITKSDLELVHQMKTGALIRVSVEGASVVCGVSEEEQSLSRKFGEQIGLAFQLTDDLLDFDPDDPEFGNFATQLGVDATKRLLDSVSNEALGILHKLSGRFKNSDLLKAMVEYNRSRAF